MQACQAAVTSREFAEWVVFYRIHPFGEEMMDARFAALEALVANLWTDGKKKRWTPKDFMPDFEKALDEASEAEEETPQANVVDKIRTFFGGLAQASRQKAESEANPTPDPSPNESASFGEESKT